MHCPASKLRRPPPSEASGLPERIEPDLERPGGAAPFNQRPMSSSPSMIRLALTLTHTLTFTYTPAPVFNRAINLAPFTIILRLDCAPRGLLGDQVLQRRGLVVHLQRPQPPPLAARPAAE